MEQLVIWNKGRRRWFLTFLAGIAIIHLSSNIQQQGPQQEEEMTMTSGRNVKRIGRRQLRTTTTAAAATNTASAGAEASREEGGKGGIFLDALYLDQTKIGIMMGLIIIAQLILDVVLSNIELTVGASSKLLLAEVYKELATLGLVSFILFLIQSFHPNIDHGSLSAFEYSHVLIFGLAICYIIQSGIFIRGITPVKRDIMKQNALACEDIIQQAIQVAAAKRRRKAHKDRKLLHQQQQQHSKQGKQRKEEPASSSPSTTLPITSSSSNRRCRHLSPLASMQITRSKERFWGFKTFRERFILLRALPPSFLYDRYLLEIYHHWVMMELEISSGGWATLVFIFLVHAGLSTYLPTLSQLLLHPYTFCLYGWLMFGIDLLIFNTVHYVHQRALGQLKSSSSSTDYLPTYSKRNTGGYPTYLPSAEKQGKGEKRVGRYQEEGEPPMLHRQYSSNHNALAMVKRRRTEIFNALEMARSESISESPTNHSTSTSMLLRRRSPSSLIEEDRLGGGRRRREHHHHSTGGRHSSSGGLLRHVFHSQDLEDEAALALLGGGETGYGFTVYEWRLFDWGTRIMSIIRCLYLATFLVAYLGHDLSTFSLSTSLVLVTLTPLPVILSITIVIPRMVVRFLLVKSLSSVNLNALDSVVEYMECVEDAFKDICYLLSGLTDMDEEDPKKQGASLEQLFADFDTDNSGDLSYKELRLALKKHGINLKQNFFEALVRFVDSDMNGTVNLTEFKNLLKGDNVFYMQGIDGVFEGQEDEEEGEEEGEEEADGAAAAEKGEEVYSDAVEQQALSPPTYPSASNGRSQYGAM